MLIALLLFPKVHLYAQPRCLSVNGDIPVRSTLASAGFFANLRRTDTSLRVRMDQLLNEASAVAKQVTVSESGCLSSCKRRVAAVVFKSLPNVALSGYDEASVCEKFLEVTQRDPIRYENRRFSSDEDAESWYRDLTQGDGADGEDLYKRCPGKCSPQYTSVIFKEGDGLIVSTEVICGHARDRDDDQYALSAAVRWLCF